MCTDAATKSSVGRDEKLIFKLMWLYMIACVVVIEDYYLEVEDDPITFLYSSYGEITANIVYLNSTIFSYSIAAAFDNETSSNLCALLFVDNDGNLVATTRFIKRYLIILSICIYVNIITLFI